MGLVSRVGKEARPGSPPAASAQSPSWCPGGPGSPVAKGSPVAAMARAWEPAWSLEEPLAGPAPSLAQHLLLTSLVSARPPLPRQGRGSPLLAHARTPTVVSGPETPMAT